METWYPAFILDGKEPHKQAAYVYGIEFARPPLSLIPEPKQLQAQQLVWPLGPYLIERFGKTPGMQPARPDNLSNMVAKQERSRPQYKKIAWRIEIENAGGLESIAMDLWNAGKIKQPSIASFSKLATEFVARHYPILKSYLTR